MAVRIGFSSGTSARMVRRSAILMIALLVASPEERARLCSPTQESVAPAGPARRQCFSLRFRRQRVGLLPLVLPAPPPLCWSGVGGVSTLPWLEVPDAAAPAVSIGADVPALGGATPVPVLLVPLFVALALSLPTAPGALAGTGALGFASLPPAGVALGACAVLDGLATPVAAPDCCDAASRCCDSTWPVRASTRTR